LRICLALAQHSDALLIFSDIDELEVIAEGFDKDTQCFQGQSSDLSLKRISRRSITTPPSLGQRAHGLDEIECGDSVLLTDHPPQERPEEFDVRAERCVQISGGVREGARRRCHFRHSVYPRDRRRSHQRI